MDGLGVACAAVEGEHVKGEDGAVGATVDITTYHTDDPEFEIPQ